MTLYEHFEQLVNEIPAIQWGVEVDYDGEPRGAAEMLRVFDVLENKIVISHEPVTPWTYFLALHEIGHLRVLGRRHRSIADYEALSWRWALDHSMIPADADIKARIVDSLESYRSLEWESLMLDLTGVWTSDTRAHGS